MLSMGDYSVEVNIAQALPLVVGFTAGLIGCLVYDITKHLGHYLPSYVRERIMAGTKSVRERLLRRQLSDRICAFMEDDFHKGKITLDEKKEWYRRFGSTGLTDLLPRHKEKFPNPEDLKEAIRGRVKKKTPTVLGNSAFKLRVVR